MHTADKAIFQLVVPNKLRNAALKLAHSSKISGHPGIYKTYGKAKNMFYFPGLLSYTADYVKKCGPCQRRKGKAKINAPLQSFPPIHEPLDRVGADLIDLHNSYSGHRYALVLVDHLSRYCTLVPIPRKDPQTVAEAFLTHFVTVFGPPKVLVTDRGKEFVGKIFEEVCTILQTTTALTTAFRPQSNGLVERTNRTIKDTLAILVEKDPHNWDKQLPFVQFALNTAIHKSINTQPLFLFTGHSCHLSAGLVNKHVVYYGEDFKSEVLSKMRTAWYAATEASRIAQSQYAHYYDKNVRPCQLREGSLVLLQNDTSPADQSRRLVPRWVGPYRITQKTGPVNFKIRHVFSKDVEKLVHVNKLKPFNPREELSLPNLSDSGVLGQNMPDNVNVNDNNDEDSDDDEDDPLANTFLSLVRPHHSSHPMMTRSRV